MSDYLKDIERLKALISYDILDTPEDASFDGLAQLVSIICNTPAAIISFIDDKRQWYKAKIGATDSEVPIEETICQYVIVKGELIEISNTLEDERLVDNSHVHQENGVRFYIGVPLFSDNGHAIGTVCTFDSVPKKLSDEQKSALQIIAKHTMNLLDVSKKNEALTKEVKIILEQKIQEAKDQIRSTEAAYNTLFGAIDKSNAVIEFSPKGIIQYVNHSFLEITGYVEEELIGKHHQILLDEKDKAINESFWESLNDDKFKSGRFKRKHKNGSIIWIQASYSPVLNSKKEVIKVTKIAQNITSEIHAQEALKKAKSLADELNVQKDHFIANMSHEIRTPINAVLGFTDLLLDEETNDKKVTYLKSVKTAGDNLLYLINDILDLSKIEAGIFQIDHTPFNLYETIDDVFSILSLKAQQKNLLFSKSIASNVSEYIIGDKNRLTQILINLLGNSIKFTLEGSIMLNVYLENATTLKFDVIDTGIGIPENKLTAVFERFSQAEETTSRQFGGSGLGLNISKLLVEKQGGNINVESTLNKGSKFSFTLPFVPSFENKEKALSKEKTKIASENSARVLMCEDNEMNQKLMEAIFLGTNHKLDIANNGNEGLKLLSEKEYDLILMDIQMPELDGIETTKIIRNELKISIPIIAITANSSIKERERFLTIGMTDYVSKPFKKEELLDKINYLVFEKKTTQNNQQKAESKSENSVVSLEYLKEMSGGNTDFIKEMLSLFLNQSEENKQLIKENFESSNFKMVSKIAHTLKSSFGMIGANLSILDAIENNGNNAEVDSESLKENIQKLDDQINLVNNEIKQIQKNIKDYESCNY